MDDIDVFRTELDQRYPNQAQFIFGHSLGGLITLNYILRRKPNINGVIVSGPALYTAVSEQKMRVVLAKIMGSILPALTMPSGLEPTHISRDPQVVQTYVDDPLVHDRTTLAMAKHTLESISWVFDHAPGFHLPLLLMHGTEDRLCFVAGSQALVERIPSECTLKLWPGLHHEIHNEPEQDEVLAYLNTWLEAHLSA